MFYRNKKIEATIAKVVGRNLAILFYIMFAGMVVLVEEVMMSREYYRQTEKIMKLKSKSQKVYKIGDYKIKFTKLNTTTHFKDLPMEDQKSYIQFYGSITSNRAWRLQIMARESATQLCLQTALVLYQYLYQPMFDMNYQEWRYPTFIWCMVLIIRLISIFLSAYSTFTPVMDNLKLKEYNRIQRPPYFSMYVIKVLQTMLHIIFGTFLTYL